MIIKFTKLLFLLCYTGFLFCCIQATSADKIPPHEIFKIDSGSVGETRVISVWTPPSYKDSEGIYPVLYMPDGGIGEDFPHIANTLSDLVERGEIAPLILVGIENTERRRDLTGPSVVAADAKIAPLSNGSRKFREFIRLELFPEISKRYRVNNQRAIVGESAAGLFVVETFFRQPQMFDIYISMDPALYWNDRELVRNSSQRLKTMSQRNIKFWFAGSDAKDIFPHTEELSKTLETDAPENLMWSYLPQPKEHHNTIFRATKEKAFKWGLWTNKIINP